MVCFKFRECCELLWQEISPKAEGLFMTYVRPEILYGSEVWCLNESEMGIL